MPQSKKGKYSSRLSNTRKQGTHGSFRTHEGFYRMMIESLDGQSIFTTDKGGVISSWNSGSEKLFGYKEKEVIGKNVSLIFTPEDIKKNIPKKELKEAKKKDKVVEERNHIRKNGSLFWASGLIYPLRDEKKVHRGFTFILINRTEEKAFDKRKDDFISTATHELKTPVMSIRLFAEIVEQQTKKMGDKIGLESVRELNIQLDRLTALMNYLLDVAKIQQGKLKLEKTFFDVSVFIHEVITVVKGISTGHIIRFTKSTPKEMYADRERISQVLTNLVSNAIKYSEKGTKVIVKSTHDKKNIIISIQDFGFGIPKSEQKLIFSRFYRANSAIENNISGIGLGLYVAIQIVKAHHGKMWVKSAVGKGSTFYFSIPIKTK